MKSKLKAFFFGVIKYIKVAKVELIILFGLLVLDLVTKAVIAGVMTQGESVTLIPKFLHFTYIHNDGAAFGSTFGLDKLLGEKGTTIFFIIFTAIAICFFSYFLYRGRGKHLLNRIALSMIVSGAIGNLVDRIFLGYVRDFVEIEYFGLTIFGSTSFAIFNIADVALTVGVILFAVYCIFIYKDPKEKRKEENASESVNVETAEEKDENND